MGYHHSPQLIGMLFNCEPLSDAEDQPPLARTFQPWLFPGAAYPISNVMTGMRGRVLRQKTVDKPERPARWVRVIATIPDDEVNLSAATIIGRAFGDDRGEFLLLIDSGVALIPTEHQVSLRITIFATDTDPVPSANDRPDIDALWDLPLEMPTSLSAMDEVLIGNKLPNNYVQVAEDVVSLPLGYLTRGKPDFIF
jgi:hypothetical protein